MPLLLALSGCSAYYDYAMPQPLIVPTAALAGAVAIEDELETPEQDDKESSLLELAYDVIRTPGHVLGYGFVVQGAFVWAVWDELIGNPVDINAKLDRLSRDAHFLLGLQKAGVDFVAADMPDANRMTVGIMAIIAQHEREQISARTKAALAAAKARGARLGNPANLANRKLGSQRGTAARSARATARATDLATIITELRTNGATSLRALADALNARGYFGDAPPARSTIEVARLPRDALVEIELVALA